MLRAAFTKPPEPNYPVRICIGWHVRDDVCIPQETVSLAPDREAAAAIVANYMANPAVKSVSVSNLF